MFKQRIPYTYYFAGSNNIYTISGHFDLELTNQGQISNRAVIVATQDKHRLDGDVLGQIINVHTPNDKILCTLPLKLQRELRARTPRHFLYGLAEDETKWYTKESILEFRQTLYDYQLPINLIKNLSQYLRTEDDNLKCLIGLVKTVERYFRRRTYNQYLGQQISGVSYPL